MSKQFIFIDFFFKLFVSSYDTLDRTRNKKNDRIKSMHEFESHWNSNIDSCQMDLGWLMGQEQRESFV